MKSATGPIIAIGLVLLCVAAFLWDSALAYAMMGRLHGNDFGKFYYSARAFLDGRDMYAPSPATDLMLQRAEGLQFLNMNPPHFHLIVLPLALLSPARAVGVWIGLNLFALVLAMFIIFGQNPAAWTPRRLLLLAFGTLAFAGTQAFFATGQLSMLLLLAVTICWVDARHGRWNRAAIWLGACLSVKPFLLIFVPYLLGKRLFRSVGLVAITCGACFAAGVVVFGAEAYQAWYRVLVQSGDWAWTGMNASAFGIFRRAFAPSPDFAAVIVSPRLESAWLVVAGAVGVTTLAVTMGSGVRRSDGQRSTDYAFALMLVAAQLISPLGWVYYLWLPAGPIALVVIARRPQGSGPLRWLRTSPAVVAIAGFLWPLALPAFLQPSAVATLTIGSLYFWATAATWVWLLLERSA